MAGKAGSPAFVRRDWVEIVKWESWPRAHPIDPILLEFLLLWQALVVIGGKIGLLLN